MAKIIEAKAVISASDKTGAVFDKIAQKLKGVEKVAKSFEGIRAPVLGKAGWGQSFQRDIDALKVSSKELAEIQRSWAGFNTAMARNGPVRASKYFDSVSQWKQQTLSNLREVRMGMDETEKVHRRFFAGAGRFALHAAGIGGAAYATSHMVRGAVGASSERAREFARYSLGGLSDDEKTEAMAKAGEISSKYPSIGRTQILEHIRQLRSRLGDFHHAIQNVETLTKAQVVLGTIGHGENAPEDLERLVLGLESQGIGSQPEKFKTYLNAFTRAKSLFPDLRGEDFRQYMKNANASKYGLTEDYLTNVVPTMMQHEGASNFGVMQASAFSALIGGRQTPAAKAMMQRFGLLDKDKHLINESDFIKNPLKWAEANVVPALQKHGIATDEEHRGDLVKAMTTMFSNRKVGEFFASMLVNRSIIEKDAALLQRAKGTEGAEQAQRDDPFKAWAGVTKQAADLSTAFISLKGSVSALNAAAGILAKMTKALETGKMPEDTPYGRATGPAAQIQRINERMKHSPGMPEATKKILRQKAFDAQMEINRAKSQEGMPDTLFSDKEIEDWKTGGPPIPWKGRVPFPHRDPRGGFPKSDIYVPLPKEDPRPRTLAMPPVQPMDAPPTKVEVSGDVHGEMKQTIRVEAGSYLKVLIATAEQVVKLYGSLNGNGPGSAGHSSPDAGAASSGQGGQ